MASVTGSVIRVDEQELRGHLDEVVRTSVKETLNGMLDAEADRLRQAKRYERTAERMDTRAGSYERKLQTKAGRTRVVGAFPDGRSALMLVAARLRHVAGSRWGTRKYLDMNRLGEHEHDKTFESRAQQNEELTLTQ